MKIEVGAGKTYQTRNGLKAIVHEKNSLNNHYPFIGEVIGKNGGPSRQTWSHYVEYNITFGHNALDLVEGWVEPQSAPVDTVPQDDQSEPVAGYESLAVVLNEALDQASHGKGKERHANGHDFLDQPIMEIGRMVGVGYQTGQAMKKTQEAVGMLNRDQKDRAIAELLGAINYLAVAVILIREGEKE